ncbi:hypothetical protein BV22DRAFT_1052881 [Leucogyrophana mollusca]|uniref:Uncharacterized protein n=1 Tax=Leucogyrophana mollusca TaxID=85980 RepID=A0ACB8AU68_9AGAM|nr:hypothetical protein BV22DRAFT_1052881 [Leucogyrophana mollusca]
MFLLTESTLFFLDRATCRATKKFSLSGQVSNWATGVSRAKAGSPRGSVISTSTSGGPPPSTSSFHSQSSKATTVSTNVHSASKPTNTPDVPADALAGGLSDDEAMMGDIRERQAALAIRSKGKAARVGAKASYPIAQIVPASCSDTEDSESELVEPISKQLPAKFARVSSVTVKRKASKVSVPETASEGSFISDQSDVEFVEPEDTVMDVDITVIKSEPEPIVKKEPTHRRTTSVSAAFW